MRSAIIAEAESWIGTPFRHQGRAKGVGVDCVGLPVAVAQALGLLPGDYDTGPYGRQPNPRELLSRAAAVGRRVDIADAGPGDVLLLALPPDRVPMHFGILDYAGGLIHASEPLGRVVRHGMTPEWWRQVHAVYRLPGVA